MYMMLQQQHLTLVAKYQSQQTTTGGLPSAPYTVLLRALERVQIS